MRTHDLKTDPDVFDAMLRGEKNFEIRFDDRKFEVGDELLLRRTKHTGAEMGAAVPFCKPLVYTGEEMTVRVTYILRGPRFGLSAGWVIMSVEIIPLAK